MANVETANIAANPLPPLQTAVERENGLGLRHESGRPPPLSICRTTFAHGLPAWQGDLADWSKSLDPRHPRGGVKARHLGALHADGRNVRLPIGIYGREIEKRRLGWGVPRPPITKNLLFP